MKKRGTLTLLSILFLFAFSTTALAATANTTSHVFILNSVPYVVQVLISPNPAEVGIDTMIVKANITDNNGVPADIFSVNATYDFGTPGTPGDDFTVWLVYNASSGLYENNTYSIPNNGTLGTWNVTVIAEDDNAATGSNFTTFTVQDTINPYVDIIAPDPGTNYSTSSTVFIQVNATDNGVIDTCMANISFDSTTDWATLTYNATSYLYEVYYTNTSYPDVYNVTIYCNDTANNMNDSETTYFNIGDNTPPVINSISDSPDPVDPGNVINFTANVTDNIAVDTVTIEVNGANTTMTPAGGDIYYYDGFDTFLAPGTYNYTVFANDTSNNNATPQSGTFTVNPLISLTLYNTPIDFGNTTIPVTDRRADNGTAGSGYLGGTVKGFPLIVNNTGNVNENMSISGTNLIGDPDGTQVIGIGNMTYNLTQSPPGDQMSTSDTVFKTSMAMWTTQDLYFWISLPAGLKSQDYNGNVTITAVQS